MSSTPSFLEQLEKSFTKGGDYKAEKFALGAVAVAGAGYLAYGEWLKHHSKEHSEETQAEFANQVQPGWNEHPEFHANYGENGKFAPK